MPTDVLIFFCCLFIMFYLCLIVGLCFFMLEVGSGAV